MRNSTTIILLLFCQQLFGQIKFGTYSQLDTFFYANLKLYSNKKFDFYDTRDSSCWGWTRTLGNWKLNKDTIIFSWQSSSTESSDSIISSRDLKNENIEIKFIYDNGIPIPNVETSLSCLFDNDQKKYYTDINGKLTIPNSKSNGSQIKKCLTHERMLYFDIKNEVVKLSANTSLDYFVDSLDNVFTIVVKRKPITTYKIQTKKYLVKNNILLDIDPKEFFNYNWGNFKYKTRKYGR